MKIFIGSLPLLLALVPCEISVKAFVPVGMNIASRQSSARALAPMDPSNLQELPHHIQSLRDVMSTISIADLDAVAIPAGEITEAAKSNSGWFGFLTEPTMAFLQLIHSTFVSVGLDSNAWGISIIFLTLTIKLLTFPLTKSQLESTQKMQALQPTLKEVQAKYQSNPEVMNQKIAELYKTNDVNPLAGCIPSIVQIPVFIGLYRAVLDLANQNELDESFLWLPSLEGPTYGADPSKGSAWLFDNWANGAPSLGWGETVGFLVLPVILVLSQFLSMEIMSTKEQKESQPSFLKALPLLIGWFSLNVPSALTVYWVTNNFVTTASSVIIRNSLKMEPATVGAAVEDLSSPQANSNVFTPPTIREKPEGFASSAPSPSSAGVTPITSSDGAIDAEILSEESNEPSQVAETISTKKKRGKKRKKRRKN